MKENLNSKERFQLAFQNQETDRPPVWMMRQAGRISPEYRDIRKTHSTLHMMQTPELAKDITLLPLNTNLGTEAAILYSDILMIPDALGMGLNFAPGEGPQFEFPLNSEESFAKLNTENINARLDYVFETIKLTQKEIDPNIPILGFAGAPFTVACYMIAGKGSKNFAEVKALAWNQPKLFQKIMNLLTESTIDYLIEQANCGVIAIQLFDTWGGLLSQKDFEELSKPYCERIFSVLKKEGIPTIFYLKNGSHLIDSATDMSFSTLAIDWRVDIAKIDERVDHKFAIQGNLDPDVLLTNPDVIREKVRDMLIAKRQINKGYIANLGHGVLPQTPLENVKAFFQAVKDLPSQL